jgi:hypothetical protein
VRLVSLLLLVFGTVVALGCGGVWDVEALESRNPPLRTAGAHRLGDATPYLLPLEDQLTLFLCRWGVERPLRASLPPRATPRERRLLERALRAWEEAVPGLHFAVDVSVPEPDLAIRFETPSPERSAQTAAECGVDLDAPRDEERLAARLVSARVALRRTHRNWRDQEVELTDEELLGSALHELGHALGFQGHARRGPSVMVRSLDDVRLAARRLLTGKPFRDATVAALYRVPSGSVVGRHRLPVGRTAPLDRLRAAAARHGLAGPVVRVGDQGARIAWQDPRGADYAFFMDRVEEVLRDPSRLILVPSAPARALLKVAPSP